MSAIVVHQVVLFASICLAAARPGPAAAGFGRLARRAGFGRLRFGRLARLIVIPVAAGSRLVLRGRLVVLRGRRLVLPLHASFEQLLEREQSDEYRQDDEDGLQGRLGGLAGKLDRDALGPGRSFAGRRRRTTTAIVIDGVIIILHTLVVGRHGGIVVEPTGALHPVVDVLEISRRRRCLICHRRGHVGLDRGGRSCSSIFGLLLV
mmetsp:Transcript_6048/g.14483  ORF Transcript_6048/g.14483 Transcript_6048/m.14483 type:complete len:206 (+) Transcript_6048:266-883(+)